MRVLNDQALKSDVELMFDETMRRDPKPMRDWFKSSWLKQLLKNDWFAKNFLHKIEPIGDSGRFQGFGKAAEGLLVRVGGKKVDIREYTPYDVKDAKAGLLYWYQPTTHSLSFYKGQEDILLVKDYFAALLDADPNTDLRRINAQDVVRAARAWHDEEVRRRAEERKAPAKARWKTLSEGRDWTPVCEVKDSLGDVYQMIRLVSPKALVVESELMAHCTYMYKGDNLAHAHIFDGRTVIVSLRRVKNMAEPVATAEFTVEKDKPVYIVQVKPYHNGWADEQGKKEELPAGLESAVTHAAHDPSNLPRFQPIKRPEQVFEVKK